MKAYPNIQLTVSEMGQVRAINEVNAGMDLRDYFAGQVIIGLLNESNSDFADDAIAELAYSLADAMMKARNK